MREILFRGKIKHIGGWVEGYPLRHKGSYGPAQAVIIRDMPWDIAAYWVEAETVGQYTGMEDRNGVKIFEGDIVEFEDAEADSDGYHDNVFTNRGSVSICPYGGISFSNRQTVDMDDLYVSDVTIDAKVIGNTFDNPELLEGGEEDG